MDSLDKERSCDIHIGTYDSESVFHIYHTARLFYPDKKITVDEIHEDTDFELTRSDEGISFTDGEKTLFSDSSDKESIKRLVFSFLREKTGKVIPWGTLIGVRPVKIASKMLNEGKSDKEIIDTYRNFYLVSSEKSELALEIAKKEKEILDRTEYDECGIYIDMPFCPTKCFYCSFLSVPSSDRKLLSEYIDTLLYDIEKTSEMVKEAHLKPAYIYFGGGTPTAPDDEDFERVLESISKNFITGNKIKEYTIECGRPDTINERKLKAMKSHGCDRISINPQSMKDDTLILMGRTHGSDDIIRTYKLAEKIGFHSVNMDVIAGLPGETPEDFENTINRVIGLSPDNVTVHCLSVKSGSYLKESGKFRLSPAEDIEKMVEIASERLCREGYLPYYLYRQKNISGNLENTGYSKKGREGIYNIAMMEETIPVISCGASGITKVITDMPGRDRIMRHSSKKDIRLYIDNIETILKEKKELTGRNCRKQEG